MRFLRCAVAWFQASASASVISSGTYTTITVAAPDSIEVANPILYVYNGNGDHGYTGDTSSHSFSTGGGGTYSEVAGASISISKLWPGYKATFCIKTNTTNSTNITSGSLKLTSYTATNKSNRKTLNSSKTSTNGTIHIEDAINIYVGINGTGSYEAGEDSFEYAGASLANTYLIESASVGASDIYCFYTIEFAPESDTWYTEYVRQSSSYVVAPEAQPDSVSSSENSRYFAQDTDGDSSCYEGLSFSVTGLSLEMY